MEIPKGSFFALAGATGSGKSTLIQCLNGLLLPTEGEVLVDEFRLTSERLNRQQLANLRRHVGLVFQYPEHQLFEETVSADIAFGLRMLTLEEDEIQRRIRQACRDVDLPLELLDSSPFQLSGGQMRRVALAGVLAMQPEILVLDEPTAGLDPRGSREVMDRIAEMRRRRDMTVVLVTHDMDEIARYADHMAVLHQGRLVAVGSPASIFAAQAPQLVQWGLGLPSANQVVHLLADRGWEIDRSLLETETIAAEISRLWKLRRAGRGSRGEHHVL